MCFLSDMELLLLNYVSGSVSVVSCCFCSVVSHHWLSRHWLSMWWLCRLYGATRLPNLDKELRDWMARFRREHSVFEYETETEEIQEEEEVKEEEEDDDEEEEEVEVVVEERPRRWLPPPPLPPPPPMPLLPPPLPPSNSKSKKRKEPVAWPDFFQPLP